jgi:hypothetical protein
VFWVRVLIWVSLAALGVTVVVMTFRGGPIPDEEGTAGRAPAAVERGAPSAGSRGEMAYDRWRPGERNDPERLRQPSP